MTTSEMQAIEDGLSELDVWLKTYGPLFARVLGVEFDPLENNLAKARKVLRAVKGAS